MIKIKKIDLDNTVVFRERHDYGIFPLAHYYVHWVTDRATKYFGGKLGYSVQLSIGAYHAGKERALVGTKKQVENLQQKIIDRILTQPKFVQSLDRRGKKIAKEFEIFSRKLLLGQVKLNANNQLVKAHKQWLYYYEEYGFWNCLIWFVLGDVFANYVQKILTTTYGLTIAETILLMTPTRSSYTFREEIGLLKIAEKINFTLKSFSKQSDQIQRQLNNHVHQWEFIYWDYIGPDRLSIKNSWKRINKFPNRAAVKEAIQVKLAYHKQIMIDQKKLIVQKKISPKHQRIIFDLHTITLMQDDKKEVCTLAQFALHQSIYKDIGRRLKIKAVHCVKFSEEELWSALGGNRRVLKTYNQRLTAVASITQAGKIIVEYGREPKSLYQKFNITDTREEMASGSGVSMGRVTGRVRVLLSPTHIYKIKKGEILIARMTTPDYVPAMKLAAAIVTNEGGMTSHAAIVSRELEVPCIVGTKIATQIFKDGDLVEVDANKGIVRLVSGGK